MDYSKIDAALAAAIAVAPDRVNKSLLVWIHASKGLTAEAYQLLDDFDVFVRNHVLTGTLSVNEIAILSGKDWVKKISLAQKLKPLDAPAA